MAGLIPAKNNSSMELTAPNHRSALDARSALCLHIEAHWPGASESERWARERSI
jgi:hypothetical protein